MPHAERRLAPTGEQMRRELAQMGFFLSEGDIEKLAHRFRQVFENLEAIRAIDVTGYEPDAVFAPRKRPSAD